MPLRPGAREDAHERDAPAGQRRGVLLVFRGCEGCAAQVREVERFVGAEEPRWREEDLAVVEAQVAPVAEVGARDFAGSVEGVWVSGGSGF